MPGREALLERLWREVINPNAEAEGLQRIVAYCARHPDAPFAQVGPSIQRALAAGVSPRDLCRIQHAAAYEAVFGTLFALGDAQLETNQVQGLHEELLTAPDARTDA
jgi:hypothetical protein